MPNFKKIVAVSLSAVCLMASCNKTLNAEGAKKWVDAQYAKTTLKTFKGINVVANLKPGNDDLSKKTADEMLQDMAASAGLTYTKGSYSLKGDAKEDSEAYIEFKNNCSVKITSKDITDYEEIKEEQEVTGTVTYTTNSGELSVYCNFQNKGKVKLKQKIAELDIYDNCGQLRYVKQVVEAKEDTLSLTGSIISTISFSK